MSCIRFNTRAQRQAMRDHSPGILTAEQAAVLHPAPQFTESKLRRLRLLATDPNPKIREAVASSYNTPEDLFLELANDPDEGVRGCVAKNEATPCDILRSLASDRSETVRGWVAVNYSVPADVMEKLANDRSRTVRSLVKWKAQLAEEESTLERAGEPALQP
ncbi:HEAT repeat domain-containing protein [Leifsonia sp. McL0607]|uniref:HEAT repeat domain-containing protein n=1 Tax=Leifsonia sp. McL0607 TaxID=3415672 RepID=UPI003CEDC4B1